MKTIARKRSKVKKKASSKKKATKKTARRVTKKTSKKAKKKAVRKVVTVHPKRKKVVKKAKAVKRASVITRLAKKKSAAKKKKVAKKKKAARRKVVRKKASKRMTIVQRDHLSRLTELVRQQRAAIVGTDYVPRVGKKKGKGRIVNQRGPLRAMIERTLARPMAESQMVERLQEKIPDLFTKGEDWVETDESIIIQRLVQAEQLGVFDEEARENALEFDWDLRDVYELWHSPEVYF